MAIAYLPPEVVTNIFLRLPPKTISILRLVNKFCLHFISSRDFAKAHLKNSIKDKTLSRYRLIFSTSSGRRSLKQFSVESLLCRSSSINVVKLEYPKYWLRNPDFHLVGSCDGLVCFVLKERHVFVWNPCTGKYKKLPRLDVDEEMYLGVTYGFGYDDSNDDYKVVALCLYEDEGCKDGERDHCVVSVFSLKRKNWKRIRDFKGCVSDIDRGKLASGRVHWWTSTGYDNSSRGDIVSFDLRSEVFGIVEQPNYGDGQFEMTLDVLEGCICLLLSCEQMHNVDLWVMKEYGVKESWTKVVTVSCVNILGRPESFRPCSVIPNGEILFESRESFAVYNPKDDSFWNPGIRRLHYIFKPVLYVQSFVSPVG